MALTKRSKVEKERLKTEILTRIGKGKRYITIREEMKNEFKLPPRTFARYWKKLMNEEEKKFFKEKNEILVGFNERHKTRVEEALKHYWQTNKKDWLDLSRKFDRDYAKIMGLMGVTDIQPVKVEITHITYKKPEWLEKENASN